MNSFVDFCAIVIIYIQLLATKMSQFIFQDGDCDSFYGCTKKEIIEYHWDRLKGTPKAPNLAYTGTSPQGIRMYRVKDQISVKRLGIVFGNCCKTIYFPYQEIWVARLHDKYVAMVEFAEEDKVILQMEKPGNKPPRKHIVQDIENFFCKKYNVPSVKPGYKPEVVLTKNGGVNEQK